MVFIPPLTRKLNYKHMITKIARIISRILWYTMCFSIGAMIFNEVHGNHQMVGIWMITSVILAFVIFMIAELTSDRNDQI